MTDGTQLLFYGVFRASIRVRNVKVEEAFVISQISEDAILGMPFLRVQRCAMDLPHINHYNIINCLIHQTITAVADR